MSGLLHGTLYGLVIVNVLLVVIAVGIWFERKFAGRMQSRLGPTRRTSSRPKPTGPCSTWRRSWRSSARWARRRSCPSPPTSSPPISTSA